MSFLDWKYKPRPAQSNGQAAEPTQATPAAEPEETPEGFCSRNVKIITFVVCITVFLLLFGPWNIFRLWNRAELETVEGMPMTQMTVLGFASLGEELKLSHLLQYEGETSKNQYRITYTAEFEAYILLAIQDRQTGSLLSCTLSHVESADRVDVMRGDVADFFAAHPYEKG